MTSKESNRALFGPFEVDLHTRELWKHGTRLKLVGQPFEILAMLLSHPGELVTRDEMRDRLWPSDTFVDFNHGLNAAVNKLREALSDSAENPDYIETLPRRGYRFIAAIEWIMTKSPATERPAALQEETPAVRASSEAPIMSEENHPRQWAFARRFMVVAAVTGLIVTSSLVIWRVRREPAFSANAMVPHIRPLLAVPDTWSPAFSPDGNSVVFYHRGPQGAGIYVSRVESDQLEQLTRQENDGFPVWSPDGQWVAFSRRANNENYIYLVRVDGSEQKREAEAGFGGRPVAYTSGGAAVERKLDTGGVVPRRREMDWSPDGKLIAFSGPSGIYLLSLDNNAVRRIVESPAGVDDWGPKFSPDGRRIMFVRNCQVGEPDEIRVVATSGGESARLLAERGRIASVPQWSPDGGSVIFSSNRTGHPALFRVSLSSPDSPAAISEAGSPAWDPAVSRSGYRLAFERLVRSLSIWQLDLSKSDQNRLYLLVASTSDTDQGPGPQFSPDGKRLAFMSDRNGTMEIWVANRDGSNPFQLTAVGDAGTPRWSPDSQSIAFDVGSTTGTRIVTISLHGGAPQVLAQGVCPSWSRDGKWVYFASGRNGDWQVWKVLAGGGTAVQITKKGGHAPLESLDGRYIYYAKNPLAEPEIWRVPVAGGDETPMPLIRPGTWASWQVVNGGILFVGPSLGHQAVLSYYDAAKNRTSTLTVLDRVPFWLGATTDGKTVAFDQPGQEHSQTMLVENFR